LTEYCKTCFDDCSDVSTHGDISVNVDPQVSNCLHQQHRCVTNTNRTSRDMMLSSTSTPEHLSLGRVKLQPVGHHPGENFVNADREMLLQCVNIRRVAKPVDLSVICIVVWTKSMTLHQLQQVSNITLRNVSQIRLRLKNLCPSTFALSGERECCYYWPCAITHTHRSGIGV